MGSLKKRLFKTAKNLLPDSTVADIQRLRLKDKMGTYHPTSSYTVVSAVYNVAPYLDDYFDSLMSQTIDPNALRIVAVDDGSTDASAKVIASWQKRFPGRIEYIRTENGGQASARNVGLGKVNTDWVTFIDPDDFVSLDYFEQVDRTIAERPSLVMVSCNLVFYYEKDGHYSDSHSLKYRFNKGPRFYNVQDERHPIQLAMNSACFRVDEIKKQNLKVNEEIRPNFEDGLFVNEFLLKCTNGLLAFCSKPKYYYRKRESGTSTLDTSWLPGSGRLDIVPRLGYLALLKFAKESLGYVPYFIAQTVLYDLSWYLKRFVGHPERGALSVADGTGEAFLQALSQIMQFINAETINGIKGSWIRYEWKQALITKYKAETFPFHIAYLKRIEPSRKRMLVRTSDPNFQLFLEGRAIQPYEEKRCDADFLGSCFLSLYYRWYRYEDEAQVLSFKMQDGRTARLSVKNKQLSSSTTMRDVIGLFTKDWGEYTQSDDDIWVIMDRDTQADDNGEHFYRYMRTHHPEQRCYFVLRRDAADWKRLSEEGFNLLAFGSKKHEKVLRSCSKIISSHADDYVHSYFGDNFLQSKDFIFLQHGVTKDDLAGWLNPKPITLLITSTQQERNSIIENGSHYALGESRVALTGFPRHDALSISDSSRPQRRTILVMPTWRKYLLGETQAKGNTRELLCDFANSAYKLAWESFLNSNRLKAVSEETGCKIVFFPHANIAPYLEAGCFSIPEYVEVKTNSSGESIQKQFKEMAVMVTDFSSTAFEAAYLHKMCLYYQFDHEEIFSGGHVYTKGYFDYERNGFGPVVYTEDDLIYSLEKLAASNFEPQEPYRTRIEETFPFRDGKCCERVYAAIKALDGGTKFAD